MKAFCIKYKQDNMDITYNIWKIARDKKTAFKFAFGRSMPDDQRIVTNRGLPITITQVEEHEVSEAFPISEVPKRESPREVSDNGDWML